MMSSRVRECMTDYSNTRVIPKELRDLWAKDMRDQKGVAKIKADRYLTVVRDYFGIINATLYEKVQCVGHPRSLAHTHYSNNF